MKKKAMIKNHLNLNEIKEIKTKVLLQKNKKERSEETKEGNHIFWREVY